MDWRRGKHALHPQDNDLELGAYQSCGWKVLEGQEDERGGLSGVDRCRRARQDDILCSSKIKASGGQHVKRGPTGKRASDSEWQASRGNQSSKCAGACVGAINNQKCKALA